MDATTLFTIISTLVLKMKKVQNINARHVLSRKILKLYCIYISLQEVEKKAARYWIRPILINRFEQGDSRNLIRHAEHSDPQAYCNYLRMSPTRFNILLSIIEEQITKLDTRPSIPAKTRLELTLRYLASGDSMASISYAFRVGRTTVSEIIAETCQAIWDGLKNIVFLQPTEQNWKRIADDFEQKWNFTNCIGAIDGKHVIIQAPSNSGSLFYNYKGSHSTNLMAIADANYMFSMVDIGAEGRHNDSSVFRNSAIEKAFESQSLNIPLPQNLSGYNLPYVLVGDEAFALTNFMMRPFPKTKNLNMARKVFNYRLSRARRVVESAFGILSSRWRIYRKPIIASPATVNKIIQATVCLHNFLIKEELKESQHRPYTTLMAEDVQHNNGLQHFGRTGSNMHARSASIIRDRFAEYFMTVGAVDFQWENALQNNF